MTAPKPKRRPGRPKKENRSADILTAGFAEFAERGFDAARLDRVAARAGVAKGTLYLYYDSKEALFEAAVRSRIFPVLERIAGLVGGFEGPTRDLLRTMFELMYAKLSEEDPRTVMRIIISEGPRFPALTRFYYDQFISKIADLLDRIVARGIARGEVRAGAAADLPLVLIAPAIMGTIWQMTFMPYRPIALDQFLAAHVDLVVHGIGTGR